jgi:tight adherence protein B
VVSLAWASALSAAAVACWPAVDAPGRLRFVLPRPARRGRRPRWRGPDPATLGLIVGALATAGAVGVGAAAAIAVVGGSITRRWRRSRAERREAAERAALVEAVGALAGELRSGAHPVLAAAAVAGTGTAAVHRVLGTVAAGARLGAPLPALLARRAADEPPVAEGLARLAAAWSLADEHGATLAEMVDAVRADLEARHRLGGELRASLAGPRATAMVLAALPVLGIALGQGVGADPVRVLLGEGLGQVLLVVGCGLGCAGMAWSDRIVARAVRP